MLMLSINNFRPPRKSFSLIMNKQNISINHSCVKARCVSVFFRNSYTDTRHLSTNQYLNPISYSLSKKQRFSIKIYHFSQINK